MIASDTQTSLSIFPGGYLEPTEVGSIKHLNEANRSLHDIEHQHASVEVIQEVLMAWPPTPVRSRSDVEACAELVAAPACFECFKFSDAVRQLGTTVSDERRGEKAAQFRTQLHEALGTGRRHATWTASFSRAGTFSGNDTMR